MSSVDRLFLCGVRSFKPCLTAKEKGHMIQFYKPLTIIVGPNGSGKTTIIEALKYACTGEVPPSCNRGQGFLYDPKLLHESHVKAQIKLRFYNVQGAVYLVQRNMQLTQKQVKMEFKVLDSALVTTDPTTGEKVSLSGRCADIDRQVPELLGVSKAILEHVVFCHQENSNWPMSPDKVLKTYFDEIFAATKYTKALEMIGKYRKEMDSSTIKDLKAAVEVAAVKVKHAKERLPFTNVCHACHASQICSIILSSRPIVPAREEIANLEQLAGRHKTEIEQVAEQIRQLEEAEAQLKQTSEDVRRVTDEIAQAKMKMDGLKQEATRMYDQLDAELVENDAEIDQYQKRFAATLTAIRESVAALESSQRELATRTKTLTAAREEHFNRHARLMADAQARLRSIAERDAQIRAIAKRLGWAEFDGDAAVTSEAASLFLARLQGLSERNRAEVLRSKSDLAKARHVV
ncbi:putative DNA repair protein RAD50 [Paratrimastix pyriformis]|uniref:DNA repair protein RAD50 n=1 Tax=Paratrimastix pyriformis TaxID=342808 RepID=A0ABQ8UUP4_9EUKA|nr:putative DNA repair protein RAD50 [Paratrimastix pyriformis]